MGSQSVLHTYFNTNMSGTLQYVTKDISFDLFKSMVPGDVRIDPFNILDNQGCRHSVPYYVFSPDKFVSRLWSYTLLFLLKITIITIAHQKGKKDCL